MNIKREHSDKIETVYPLSKKNSNRRLIEDREGIAPNEKTKLLSTATTANVSSEGTFNEHTIKSEDTSHAGFSYFHCLFQGAVNVGSSISQGAVNVGSSIGSSCLFCYKKTSNSSSSVDSKANKGDNSNPTSEKPSAELILDFTSYINKVFNKIENKLSALKQTNSQNSNAIEGIKKQMFLTINDIEDSETIFKHLSGDLQDKISDLKVDVFNYNKNIDNLYNLDNLDNLFKDFKKTISKLSEELNSLDNK